MGLLKSIFKKDEPVVCYRLEKLSEIWLNASCQSSESVDKEALSAREWETEECRAFWNDHVLANYRVLKASGFLSSIEGILDILDNSKDFPSVDPEDNETPKKYNHLKDVTLREHSIQVALRLSSLLLSHHNDGERLMAKSIITGLSHDIGKMLKEIPDAAHSVNSARWCQYKLSGMQNTDQIIEAIRDHHIIPTKAQQKNPLLMALIKIDEEVRNDELLKYNFEKTEAAPKKETTTTPTETGLEPETKPIEENASSGQDENPFQDEPKDQTPEETGIPFQDEPAEKDQKEAQVQVEETEQRMPTKEPVSKEKEETTAAASVSATKEQWLNEDSLLKCLSKKIDHVGFEAFVFQGKGFFQPRVVRNTIEEMATEAGDQTFLTVLKQFIEPLIAGFGLENNQARLRFNGKVPPQKSYYFIIDASRLALPDDFRELTPRHGVRFLKSVQILEGGKS